MGRDGESKILFPTMKPLDMPKKADKAEAAPAEVKKEEVIDFSKVEIEPLFADQVDFDTFSKSDFRAVKIKACEAVKKSKKLLQFVLDDGTGEDRIILSGIHEYYEPEELVGKTAIAIVNLPPRKMMGIDSCGMLISAVHTERGEERLSLHGVTQEPYFRNVDLTAYAGEVLGVTGLLGDGRSELFSAVFGAETVSAGEIRLCGNPVRITSTWQAKQLGLAYVPRNRKENGIIKDMSILENGTIVSWRELMRHGLLDHARQRAQFEREKAALHIKMGKESDSITSLSGGNQQKVVLAKWLSCKPKVLILDNPTQGVDVGAKEEIYDIILKLAKEGVAVIVLSSEAQEVIRVCDRALVMYHGAIVGEVRGETMTEHEIMRLATGG